MKSQTALPSLVGIALLGSFMADSAHAIAIGDDVTLGDPVTRQAALSSAISGEGFTGSDNATAATLNADSNFQSFGTWMDLDELAGRSGDGANGIFNVSLTSGDWDTRQAAGTWEILDPTFWTTYGYGAISMHVGNGQADPDHFVWRLSPNTLSGEWIYNGDGTGGYKGGGLSNLRLYKAGIATVPDGGATLALFGLSLLGLPLARRCLKSRIRIQS